MQISQIVITDPPIDRLPPELESAGLSVRQHILHDTHVIYTLDDLRTWIPQHYGTEMLKVFDKLRPYAYKADLARYLLLYRLGGWYFDISVRVVQPVAEIGDVVEMITFLDLPQHSGVTYACSNAVMYARAGSEILAQTIRDICAHAAGHFYGENALYPTGPVCLGRNVARFGDGSNVLAGTLMALTPEFQKKNRAFVLPDGTLLALSKPDSQSGLAHMGLTGGNSYYELYKARRIYDESIAVDPAAAAGRIRAV